MKILLFILISCSTYLCIAQPSLKQILDDRIKVTNREPIKKNNKWGFINHKTGELTALCIYDTIKLYHGNYASVKLKSKWTFIKKNGKQVIAPTYDYIAQFYNGYALVKKNSKAGIIDTLGNVIIPTRYKFVANVEQGYFRVYTGEDLDSTAIMNTAGNVIIPFGKYIDIGSIVNGKSIVGIKKNPAYHKSNNMIYGLIGLFTNKLIISIKYNYVSLAPYEKEFYVASNDNSLIGLYDNEALLDAKGNILTTFKYVGFNRLKIPKEGGGMKTRCFITYQKRDGILYEGLIDEKGNVLLPPIYRETSNLIKDFLKIPKFKKFIIYTKN